VKQFSIFALYFGLNFRDAIISSRDNVLREEVGEVCGRVEVDWECVEEDDKRGEEIVN